MVGIVKRFEELKDTTAARVVGMAMRSDTIACSWLFHIFSDKYNRKARQLLSHR